MDIHKQQKHDEGSGDEEDKFAAYMDENGIIRMEDQEDLELDKQEFLELEEQDSLGLPEQRILGLDEALIKGLGEQESPSDEDRSGMHSWEEHFAQVDKERTFDLLETESLRNSDLISQRHDTDGLISEHHPDSSLTLPPPLDWRPPSRDQQLDMTEDEQDRGSSVGKWEEEDGSWSPQQSELPYDGSLGPDGLEEYDQTSAGEEQWDNPPSSSLVESFSQNPRTQEDIPSTFSHSLSPHPVSSPWNPRFFNQVGGLHIAPCIEDETLPESSCTDSGEGVATTPLENPKRVTSIPVKAPRSKSSFPISTPPKTWHPDDTSTKPSKPSNAPVYGRGQLNYPLPDFSKVGPRVKFPRDDQSYRPPQSRRADVPKSLTPVVFKSPAEIVREVLLSSTEKPAQEPIVPRTVPQEFQSPQQATELVHQLQEDYHKLLTKYAEAENTIDRLRLGAKIHLYSDPPKPSHSVQMGSVLQGSKFMEFTIPQMHTATFSTMNDQDDVTPESSAPASRTVSPEDVPLPLTSSISPLHTQEDVESTLTSNIGFLQQEVDQFEKLYNGGNLSPGEQKQALWELRGSLDVLERQYLKAQEECRQGQHLTSTAHPAKELDPERSLERAIFQLGIHMDDLQDKVQDSTRHRGSDPHKDATMVKESLHSAPVPSAQAPIPSLVTPYPEVHPPTDFVRQAGADLSSVKKEKAHLEEHLPQPLRHKQIQVEKEYDTLLSTYDSFKTLPDALGLEQDTWSHYDQQDARPHHPPQMADAQEHPKPSRPEDHFQFKDQPQSSRPKGYQKTVKLQEHPKDAGQYDLSRNVRPRSHQQGVRNQEHPRSAALQIQKSRPEEHVQATRPSSSSVTSKQADFQKGPPRESPRQERLQISSEARRYTGTKRLPQISKDSAQRDSVRSPPLADRRENSPKSLAVDRSVSGDNAREPYSRRSSTSSKSVSSSPQKEQLKEKRSAVHDRIVSPETDSGFLGSESGRSPTLRKQAKQLQQSREVPPDVSSTTSPRRNEVGPSRMERSQPSGTHEALWGRSQQGKQWIRPSETSSPSPGPKSLTDSESRDQSQASDSDSERDRCVDIMRGPSAGASLAPLEEASEHLRHILETRTTRDQAIQDLQKEVIQLRHHLENSLNRPSVQEKPAKPLHSSTFQDPREERVPHFASDLITSPSNGGASMKPSRSDLSKGNSVAQDSATRQSPGRVIHGDYTGSLYHLPDSSSTHRSKQTTVPFCPRCHDERKQIPGPKRTSADDDSVTPVHAACPLCDESNDSADIQSTGLCRHHISRRSPRPTRVPPFGHWVLNQTPQVAYVQPPVIPYSPPLIYGPSPSLYVPMGYNVAQIRPPRTLTPPPALRTLDLDELHWPLNRALEAAKELHVTSKRMCRSMTHDLSLQRNLRGSCLF
ncbi:microtubule organization protein AKNA [Pelodytes ibericus]